jgi:uncharacterized protein (TIGR03437 family)
MLRCAISFLADFRGLLRRTGKAARGSRYLAALLALPLCGLLQAQTQIGGGTCTTSTLNGTYFYLLSGTVLSQGSYYAYAGLGKLVANGQGSVSGQSQASLGGSLASYSLAGTYNVQGNCSGTMSLSVNGVATSPIAFQITNGGLGLVVAFSTPGEVVVGRGYRQTAQAGSIQCTIGSLTGAYGYLLTGVTSASGSTLYYSDAGSVVSDGGGNLTSQDVVNLGGTTVNLQATGSYSISSDCTGNAQLTSQSGSGNYFFAVAEDGQALLFMETDAGTTVAGTAQPQFQAPQGAVSNSASFAPALSPGALFSIFGSGLSQQTASATTIPLPGALASTQVRVNGEVAPLLYVSPNQINAQMPLGVSTGQPATLSVTSGLGRSNAVAVNVTPGAPGIFEYGQSRAIVQNPDSSLNSDADPAHPGDIVVAYLTGGGPVTPAGPLATGGPAPNGPSPTTLNYSISVGGQPVTQYYLGLTPGFVGLYQANFQVPNVASGDYPLVITVNGASSNAPVLSIAP